MERLGDQARGRLGDLARGRKRRLGEGARKGERATGRLSEKFPEGWTAVRSPGFSGKIKKTIDEQNQQEKKQHQEYHPDFDAFGYVVGDSCGRCLCFLSANHRPEHLDNNV